MEKNKPRFFNQGNAESIINAFKDGGSVPFLGYMGDARAQAVYDMILADYNFNMSDTWWNDHDSLAAQTRQLKELGYGPQYISQFLMGNGSNSQLLTPDTVSGGSGSGALENALSAVGAVTDASLSFTEAVKADTQASVGAAEAENLRSQANLNNVNAGLRPVESAASVNNLNAGANKFNSGAALDNKIIELTDEQIKSISKDIGIKEEQIKLYQKQNFWYNFQSAQELMESYSRTALYFEQKITEKHKQKALDSEVERNFAESMLMGAQEYKTYQEAAGIVIDNQNKQADWDYRQQTGVKIDADTEQQAMTLWNQGKLEESRDLMLGVFRYYLYLKSGQFYGGEYVLPNEDKSNPKSVISDDFDVNGYTYIRHGVQDAINLVGSVPVRYLFGPKSVVNGSRSGGIGVPNGSKPVPTNLPPTGGVQVPKGTKVNQHFKFGKDDYRIDSYGNLWKNGRIVE